jgi:hypothetical protein
MLYWRGLKMNIYLRNVFLLFFVFFLTILFNGVDLLILLNFLLAVRLLYKHYYQSYTPV